MTTSPQDNKEQLVNKIAFHQSEVESLKRELEKIHNSKAWKILNLYIPIADQIKLKLKYVVPISIRKKIINGINKFVPHREIIIPSSILDEWNDYNKSRHIDSIDYLNFSVISWNFRFQRPQQIATELTKYNDRVFYIENEFIPFNGNDTKDAPFLVTKKSKNLYAITLSATRNIFIYDEIPNNKDTEIMLASLKNLILKARIINPVTKIDHPFWASLYKNLSMQSIYDCMDNHLGFAENAKHQPELENYLFNNCQTTIVTSRYLKAKASKNGAKSIRVIKNACDYDHFQKAESRNLEIPRDIKTIKGPVIGYYGAIAEWFDTDILEDIAIKHSDKSIILIGNVTNNKVEKLSKKYPNVFLLGEKSYQELPNYLQIFDVCIIPFVLNELIKATHPIKLFEFFAANKQVVCTKMPEIIEYKDAIFFADKDNFSTKISEALSKPKTKLQEIAKNNTWQQIAKDFRKIAQSIIFPKVSIILLSYNNSIMCENTINSILSNSFYPNFELIIVDNNSDNDTKKMLSKFDRHEGIKIILNKENYGFAKGNNIGIKSSTGEYIILLNNDTLVTPGWIERLVFHSNNEQVGLVGPVTNSIGNEAKIKILYDPSNIKDLNDTSLNYTSQHWGQTRDVNILAAFCLIIKKDIIDKVGNLDERFGRGMFEDDDYCLRVIKHNYKLIVAEDVFIHHFGGASFSKINNKEYQKLFNDNKEKFEAKWNLKWIPHKFRND